MNAKIRKTAVWVEETHMEMGKPIAPATRKAVAVAVIANPFAGQYVEDLEPLMEIGAELGALLGDKCVAALGITPAHRPHLYGPAAHPNPAQARPFSYWKEPTPRPFLLPCAGARQALDAGSRPHVPAHRFPRPSPLYHNFPLARA